MANPGLDNILEGWNRKEQMGNQGRNSISRSITRNEDGNGKMPQGRVATGDCLGPRAVLLGVVIKEGAFTHAQNRGRGPEGKGKAKVSAYYSTKEEEDDDWIDYTRDASNQVLQDDRVLGEGCSGYSLDDYNVSQVVDYNWGADNFEEGSSKAGD